MKGIIITLFVILAAGCSTQSVQTNDRITRNSDKDKDLTLLRDWCIGGFQEQFENDPIFRAIYGGDKEGLDSYILGICTFTAHKVMYGLSEEGALRVANLLAKNLEEKDQVINDFMKEKMKECILGRGR